MQKAGYVVVFAVLLLFGHSTTAQRELTQEQLAAVLLLLGQLPVLELPMLDSVQLGAVENGGVGIRFGTDNDVMAGLEVLPSGAFAFTLSGDGVGESRVQTDAEGRVTAFETPLSILLYDYGDPDLIELTLYEKASGLSTTRYLSPEELALGRVGFQGRVRQSSSDSPEVAALSQVEQCNALWQYVDREVKVIFRGDDRLNVVAQHPSAILQAYPDGIPEQAVLFDQPVWGEADARMTRLSDASQDPNKNERAYTASVRVLVDGPTPQEEADCLNNQLSIFNLLIGAGTVDSALDALKVGLGAYDIATGGEIASPSVPLIVWGLQCREFPNVSLNCLATTADYLSYSLASLAELVLIDGPIKPIADLMVAGGLNYQPVDYLNAEVVVKVPINDGAAFPRMVFRKRLDLLTEGAPRIVSIGPMPPIFKAEEFVRFLAANDSGGYEEKEAFDLGEKVYVEVLDNFRIPGAPPSNRHATYDYKLSKEGEEIAAGLVNKVFPGFIELEPPEAGVYSLSIDIDNNTDYAADRDYYQAGRFYQPSDAPFLSTVTPSVSAEVGLEVRSVFDIQYNASSTVSSQAFAGFASSTSESSEGARGGVFHEENGLRIFVASSDRGRDKTPFDAFGFGVASENLFYAGIVSPLTVTAIDGKSFQELEFVIGDGFTNYGCCRSDTPGASFQTKFSYEIVSDGVVVASGEDLVEVGSYFKVTTPGEFDSIRARATGAGSSNAIAIDNVRVRFAN